MIDYWQKYLNMEQGKLFDEIQNLRNKLGLMRSFDSPMYHQLADIIETAEEIYQDKIAIARLKADKTPDIIELGEIESEVVEHKSKEELTLAVIDAYTTYLKDNK
jgi:hypothetical protein